MNNPFLLLSDEDLATLDSLTADEYHDLRTWYFKREDEAWSSLAQFIRCQRRPTEDAVVHLTNRGQGMIKILYPQLSYTPHLSYEQVWQFLCSLPVPQIEDMALYMPRGDLSAYAWHRNIAEFLVPLSRPESVPKLW